MCSTIDTRTRYKFKDQNLVSLIIPLMSKSRFVIKDYQFIYFLSRKNDFSSKHVLPILFELPERDSKSHHERIEDIVQNRGLGLLVGLKGGETLKFLHLVQSHFISLT